MLLKWLAAMIILFNGTGSENKLDQYLNARLSGYKSFEYEVAALPAGMNELNFSEMKLDPDKSLRINSRYAYVPVKLMNSGRSTNAYITLKMKLYREVLKARNRIDAGSCLSREDFAVVVEDVTGVSGEPVDPSMPLFNYRAKYNIPRDKVLIENYVEAVPVIDRGEMITAYKKVGSVIITFNARARVDGGIGEVIKVMDNSRNLFHAKVMDSSKVEIIE